MARWNPKNEFTPALIGAIEQAAERQRSRAVAKQQLDHQRGDAHHERRGDLRLVDPAHPDLGPLLGQVHLHVDVRHVLEHPQVEDVGPDERTEVQAGLELQRDDQALVGVEVNRPLAEAGLEGAAVASDPGVAPDVDPQVLEQAEVGDVGQAHLVRGRDRLPR